jgi:hypothetical protein
VSFGSNHRAAPQAESFPAFFWHAGRAISQENEEKIKMNKQLPYLVGNVVEVGLFPAHIFKIISTSFSAEHKILARKLGERRIKLHLITCRKLTILQRSSSNVR